MAIRLDQLRNADLNLLVYFAVLVEEKSVTRAATRLRLTQSALSRVLQRARGLFDDELLVRVNNAYQPTPRGQELLHQLSILLPQIDTVISGKRFDPATDAATFRITASDSLTHLYGPGFCRRHGAFPNAMVDFAAYTEGCYQELEENKRDLFLSVDLSVLPSHLHKEELFRERNVCAVARNSPFKSAISLSDYLSAKHISVNVVGARQLAVDEGLARVDLKRDCVVSVPYFSAALRMVATSDLIATLPRCMSELLVDRKRVRLIRPPRHVESFRYVMIWHKRQHADSRNVWLRQVVREITAELLARKLS